MKKSRILIVDDEASSLKLMDSMLTKHGYECLCKKNGEEALLAVKRFKPDLMLIDVMMPVLDGFKLTELFKANEVTQNIPIILITSLSDRNSRLEGLEIGAEEIITKPIDQMELIVRIRNLIKLKEYSDHLSQHTISLSSQVSTTIVQLQDTQLEIVRSLRRAASFKDVETGMHLTRISKLSKLIAEGMGLGENQSELIFHASTLHDIGMLGIPDRILLKPGKLTPFEWAVMKTHTAIGAKILSTEHHSNLIETAKSIAFFHHEQWDGSGYPNSIVGEEIPVEARIVAVADAFDTLTNKRPYNLNDEPYDIDMALLEIKNQKGKQFDPKIVDVFCELRPDVLSAINDLAEVN